MDFGAGGDILTKFNQYIVNPAMLVVFSAGFVVFMWGLVQFMWKLDEGDSSRKDGVNHIIWGLAGMLIMVSIWGIIALIENTFGLNGASTDVSRLNSINSTPTFLGTGFGN